MLLSTLMNSSFPLFWVGLIWVTGGCCWCCRNLVILLGVVLILEGLPISGGDKVIHVGLILMVVTLVCAAGVRDSLFKKSASIDLTAMKSDPGP